ncbi:MAG: MerR family transcriptional regulator [Planctomycetia bacterium]|nr:MerR family transcriptional regulator [Planctomycetia bacterium]
MTTTTSDCSAEELLKGQRVSLVGKLAGMSKREAQQLVRLQGGFILERPDASATLVVVGEEELPLGDGPVEGAFDEAVREAVDRGTLEIVSETQLWQRLGLVEREQHVHRLYTPAMLAQLLGVAVSVIRRWQRRGWIVPVREVRRLPYFDFQEVATARRLTELLAAGMSPATIEKKLAALQRYLPDIKRPLAQLSIIVVGKHLLLRQGDELVEPGGQLRFDFSAAADGTAPAAPESVVFASDILAFSGRGAHAWAATPAEMVQLAGQLEDEGQLQAAAEMYRAAMSAGGPRAEICFLLAELLYQMQDLPAARERYYMAVELDEDYVEARANLGCVLSELGEQELAISAFEGALAYHDDYPDVHYHLARSLDDVKRADEAVAHWEAFLRLAPMSPWADEARERLGR